jgi:PAS domain S-box-containing protein
MLGYGTKELGNDLEEWSKRVHPDDLVRTLADVEDHLAGRTACYRNEHRVRHKDGSWIWVLDRGLVIERDDAGHAVRVVGTHTDITERKRLEEQRDASFAQLETMVQERTAHLERANHDLAERDRDLRIFASVIEQSPLGILLADDARTVTYANSAAVLLLQAEVGSLTGSRLLAGVPAEAVSQAHAALDEAGHWSGQTELGEGTSTPRWVDIQIAPIAGVDGLRLGFACLLRDTTQLKRLEIEHQQRMAELMQAAKMAALGTLTAGIGHEIGNPANCISINAPLLKAYWHEVLPILERHGADHPEFSVGRQPWARIRLLVPELFAGIESGVGRIRRLIGDLRQFAIPDLGDLRPVDANAVLSAAVSLTRHAIDRATTRCTVSLDPALPAIRGSFQRLEQALVNLVLNACQALPSADRAITISTRCAASSGVLIEIADQGIGIAEADLPRLGEPFHTTKRERGGTGLGLSIVRRIVEDHGGTITIASRPGHGTTVTIALPAVGQQGPPS